MVGFIIAAISLTIVLKFKDFIDTHKELSEFECLQNKIREDNHEDDKINCKCLKQLMELGEIKAFFKWTMHDSKNKECVSWYFHRNFVHYILGY